MCKQGCGHMRKYPSWKDLQKIAKMGRYAVGDGLYMQVASGGTRSRIFRYRTGDKSFHLGLGSCRYLSLPEARQRAIDLQRQRLSGLDPMQEKRKAQRPAPAPTRPSITFREASVSASSPGLHNFSVSEEGWKPSVKSIAEAALAVKSWFFRRLKYSVRQRACVQKDSMVALQVSHSISVLGFVNFENSSVCMYRAAASSISNS